MNLLVQPVYPDTVDIFGRGLQRYANPKLAIVTGMFASNSHLEKANYFVDSLESTVLKVNECENLNLSHIIAVVFNSSNLFDSRALHTNTPTTLYYLFKYVIRYLRRLLRFMDSTMHTAVEAEADVVDPATKRRIQAKEATSHCSRRAKARRKAWMKSNNESCG